MGQQQLLLIILVTIIVGIATVVAINLFTETQKETNREAVILDMLKVVPEARAYYRKPSVMGGGGGSFENIDFVHLTMSSSNENGTYSITDRSTPSFKLIGVPVSGADTVGLVIYEDSITWE